MAAAELLREGRLQEALARLQEQVRLDPTNPKLRTFLFQLLAILGGWPRALAQLHLSGDLDDGALAMVQTYREAIRCEALRAEVFAGKRSPVFFGDPEEWGALLLQALALVAGGEHRRARALKEKAFAAAPATSGVIDGHEFEWIADADSRLGPVLEAIVNGRYYWVPFRRIMRIEIEEPVQLRDVVWMPARFTWANLGFSVGLVPTRYPGSEFHDDNFVRLARKTEWVGEDPEFCFGLGQRMLATDAGEYPVMDIRRIDFNTEAADPGPEPSRGLAGEGSSG